MLVDFVVEPSCFGDELSYKKSGLMLKCICYVNCRVTPNNKKSTLKQKLETGQTHTSGVSKKDNGLA